MFDNVKPVNLVFNCRILRRNGNSRWIANNNLFATYAQFHLNMDMRHGQGRLHIYLHMSRKCSFSTQIAQRLQEILKYMSRMSSSWVEFSCLMWSSFTIRLAWPWHHTWSEFYKHNILTKWRWCLLEWKLICITFYPTCDWCLLLINCQEGKMDPKKICSLTKFEL